MLAFVVGVAVGTKGATDDVSAATGTIDALNVGVCATTNADVFDLEDCGQLIKSNDPDYDAENPDARVRTAFFQQGPLGDLIEVDTLYGTYAHDPKTSNSPRAIIEDGDLLRISITDKDRDRRDPVLVISGKSFAAPGGTNADGVGIDAGQRTLQSDSDPATDAPNAREEIGEALGLAAGGVDVEPKYPDLPPLEPTIDIARVGADGRVTSNHGIFDNSGTYEVLWGRSDTAVFKPIAPDGVVKFFGRVNDGLAAEDENGDDSAAFGSFQELNTYISLDEDVISGEINTPPVMTLNVNVPDPTNAQVELQVIYYETSGVEYIEGNDKCFPDPDNTEDDTDTSDINEELRALAQAACTSDEIGDGDSFVLYAESDEDAADDKRHLALQETGRFTGIFQGELRLTDADGDGRGEAGDARDNWGLGKRSGKYTEKQTAEGDDSLEGAVLGVGNGPVTITYKDSDGRNRPFQIEIDIVAPSITVESPEHKGRSDDEKPSFIGSINDQDSGLAAKSFQLDVDNRNDLPDVLYIIDLSANVTGESEPVRRRQEYSGYADDDVNEQYGVIEVDGDIYKVAIPASVTAPDRYKSLEADDFDDGAPDGEFNGEIEIDFDEFETRGAFPGFNNAVDFQALVRDLAGNVGFSDSDPSGPRYINDLGEEEDDRVVPNVIGVFTRHVVYIDEIDPSIVVDASVTGFYGLDDKDNPVRDRSSAMVVFDNAVNGELIDTGTFTLEHDEETAIEIVDVDVDGKLVFLKLGEELASDATPVLTLTEGREVEDLAGNLLTWQEPLDGKDDGVKVVNLADGILPIFSVTLSGGSGTGVGSEGPSRLTNAAIDVSVDSDEDINGSPTVAVVCSTIEWTEGEDENDLDDFVANRTGYDEVRGEIGLNCGGSYEPAFRESASLSRPGNNWVYAWRNASKGNDSHLNDGKLVVVIWGRDSSLYDSHEVDFCPASTCENWGSQTTEFTLDSIFNSPLNADGSGGSVQPEADSEVKEPRPFVYLDFAGENTSVTVTELSVDGEDVHGELDSVGDNRFLYWPEALAFGTHKVEFDARDAADNEPAGNTSFEFDVTARDPFVIDLTAGWNAVSFPANPIDTALDAVFTDEAIDRVVGWNPLSATGPWSIASRIDGVWMTSANFAPLTDVVVRYGYWVHSMAFVEQSVDLKGQLDRESGDNPDPVGIITLPGWNFVGVVDQDGDQTEDHFGKDLKDSEGVDITADDYMPGYRQAYTWDAIANGYRVLDGGDPMEIGQGIWVFFPDDTTIAP